MDIILSDQADLRRLDSMDMLQAYNGLDCCVTAEVLDAIAPQLDANTSRIYNFTLAMQGPILEMMLRGMPVDNYERTKMVHKFRGEQGRAQQILNAIAYEVWGKPLNPGSHKQLKQFFFEVMNIPPITSFKKGQRKISVDREALEKLTAYVYARLPANCIIASREAGKKLDLLESEVDPDGCFRSSYNLGGTETGRLSSSTNAFGTGNNQQNITEELRRIFIAPKGMKMAVIDKEQAESRIVGLLIWLLFNDSKYLDACESGDLHSAVSQMVWPELDWPEERSFWKDFADNQLFYRHFSYRFMAKKGGHATNYFGKPFQIAREMNTEPNVVQSFQNRYFKAFPSMERWHAWTKVQLQTKGFLLTPLGRRRQFFGRANDDATLREAIAHIPQSMQVDDINSGILRAWNAKLPVFWIAQLHDAVMLFYEENLEDEVLPQVCEKLVFKYDFRGREFSIPVEPKTGWNWGDYPKQKPDGTWKGDNWDGLRPWKGKDTRQRQVEPDASLLGRCL